MTTAALKDKLLQLTVAVERAMSEADYSSYRRYVAPEASFFEPRTRGILLQGTEGEAFERFHFDHAVSRTTLNDASSCHVNVVDPCVHILDDDGHTACVAYISSLQHVDLTTGQPITRKTFNTRLWVRNDKGNWKNIHYHRG